MNKRVRKEIENGIDYVLPDYMGDIRKILSCTARAISSGSFATEGMLEASGTVEFEVLYTDSEGKLTSIVVSSDYTSKIPIKDGEYTGAFIDPTVAAVSVRVTGPRKVSLRAIVETDAMISYGDAQALKGDAAESENKECEYVSAIGERYIYSSTLEREYAEEGDRLIGMAGEEIEIISVGGEVIIDEAVPKDGGAEIKGKLSLVAIVRAPMQPPFRIKREIPFTEFIEMDESVDEITLIPRGTVTSAVLGANDDGEDKQLVFSAIAEFSCVSVANCEERIVSDLYLTDADVNNTYKTLEYTSLCSHTTERAEISTAVSRESIGIDNVSHIVHTSCDVSEIETMQTEKGAEITAVAHLSAIACEINADGTADYIPIKGSTKVSFCVNNYLQNDKNTKLLCRIIPHSADAVVDSTDITLSAVCDLEFTVLSTESISSLSTSEKGEAVCASGCEITVYYPSESDSLYSIGKRFHTPLAKLCEDNGLKSAVSTGDEGRIEAKKLFIIR